MKNDLSQHIQLMHRFFNARSTYSIKFRLHFLKKLKQHLLANQTSFCEALKKDFNKPSFETYSTEIYMVLNELNTTIKQLHKWSKGQSYNAPFPLFGKTTVKPIPYGVCAIFSPYNYPVQLTLSPLIGAIASGNCVVIKPSEYTPHTSQFLKQFLDEIFPKHLVYTVLGDGLVAEKLLAEPLDYIFFTGSSAIGKKVMASASENLTPITLELGGKNPTIVDYTCDIKLAAKRIAWGKFINAGQTCVAPDYVLVHDAIATEFLDALKKEITKAFTNKVDFPRMIHESHYVHVLKCINEDKIVYGGHFDTDTLYIEPTVLYPISLKDECMQEEIFGPVLPVIPFSKLSSAIETVRRFPKPLACYIFSKDTLRTNHLLKHLHFGGGCVNDTVMHLASLNAPFGGIGYSGLGAYHGKHSFDTFSHYRTILNSTPFEIPLRYAPYQAKLNFIKTYINLKFKF